MSTSAASSATGPATFPPRSATRGSGSRSTTAASSTAATAIAASFSAAAPPSAATASSPPATYPSPETARSSKRSPSGNAAGSRPEMLNGKNSIVSFGSSTSRYVTSSSAKRATVDGLNQRSPSSTTLRQ